LSEEEWYSIGEVWRFTVAQLKWVFRWLPVISEGRWPPGPADDIKTGHKNINMEGPSKKYDVSVEVKFRVEMTGRDGFMCQDYYSDQNFTIRDLSKKYDCPPWLVEKHVLRALLYMRGRNRKEISYAEWIKRGWKNQAVSYKRGGKDGLR